MFLSVTHITLLLFSSHSLFWLRVGWLLVYKLFVSIHFRKPVNVTSSNTTSNSPQRRSHWNELLQHPSHGKGLMSSNVATLLPTSRTSSLRRSKIQSLYAHRYSPNSTLEKSLYGEIDSHGRYRSPSRILFDSGILTLSPSHQSSHIYENLYNSVKSSQDQPDPLPSDPTTTASSSSSPPKTFLRDNLRDSVELKGSSRREATYGMKTTTTTTTGYNQSQPSLPSLPHHHHTSYKTPPHHHFRPMDDVIPPHEDVIDHSRIRREDSPLSSSLDPRTKHPFKYSSYSSSRGDREKLQPSSQQLNHHVIHMKDHHHHHSHERSSSKNKGANKSSTSSSSSSSTEKKRKKKKQRRKEWFWEVDSQRKFQFIQSTLIICNVIAIFCGVIGLVLAGFIDHRPIYRLDTVGGQMCLVSVYTILTSLAGLYGARRESCTLLVMYGCMILTALAARSVSYFIASIFSSGVSVAISMVTALLEIILILFAFALAADVRIKKLEKKSEQERIKESASPCTESSTSPNNIDESSSASTASSISSPPSTSCDRQALRV